jgi:hypothetical protein
MTFVSATKDERELNTLFVIDLMIYVSQNASDHSRYSSDAATADRAGSAIIST